MSHFARMVREDVETSLYSILYPDILDFSRRGEVLLVGDFNAKRGIRQTSLLDFHSNSIMLPELDTEDSRLSRSFVARPAPIIAYGHAFLDMGSIHKLIIYNGMV